MSSVVKRLIDAKFVETPKWLGDGIQYEVAMGSVAYGVSEDDSDVDLYGFAIPPREDVFPHLAGKVPGFDADGSFEQWQQHHIKCPHELTGNPMEYDCSIYGIVKFFKLVMDGNPNMVDSLFVPGSCLLYLTNVGRMVRDRRRMFLSKQAWPRFKGYAYEQLKKAKNKMESPEMKAVLEFEAMSKLPKSMTMVEVREELRYRNLGKSTCTGLGGYHSVDLQRWLALMESGVAKTKRFESVYHHGCDVKFLYHVCRLMDEGEQILTTGDLDLTRAKKLMKSVRRGEMTEAQVREMFDAKRTHLETVYDNCKLPDKPNRNAVRKLLLECLEQHYGSIDMAAKGQEKRATELLRDIFFTLERNQAHFKFK